MNTNAASRARAVQFRSDDDYRLSGHMFTAHQPVRGRLVVAGGTGIPQYFYSRFAAHAADRGYTTLTFDYRGVGESAPADLRDSPIGFLDWLERDLPAAVEYCHDADVPLFVVGHSLGGHGIGLLPEPQKIRGAYALATGAGWHGWMPVGERLRVLPMWYLVLGPLTHALGYSPWKMLGMGEDLPARAFYEWRRWCRNRRFFLDDANRPELQARYASFDRPIVAATAIDDPWAPPVSRDVLFSAYRSVVVERVDIDPAAIGLRSIGHIGYFRRGAEPLWNTIFDHFDALAAGGDTAGQDHAPKRGIA